jgi:hypothetical protein
MLALKISSLEIIENDDEELYQDGPANEKALWKRAFFRGPDGTRTRDLRRDRAAF